MPDRTYQVNFDASSARPAATDIDAFLQKLIELDARLDIVKPKLQGLFTGLARPINALTTSVEKLVAALGTSEVKAGAAAKAMETLGQTTRATGRATVDLRTHSDHATGSFGEWASKGLHLNATLLRVGYAAAGISSAVALWKSFAESLHNAEEYAKETADHVLKLNDEIREMKVITGQTFREAREDVAKIMTATGMNEQEATAFNTMWGSAITAAKKSGNWQLSAAETEKARIEAAQFAFTNKIDAGSFGKMVPLMGTAMPMKTADDVLRETGAVHKMGLEGAMTFTEMAKDVLKTEGKMVRPEGGGAFRSVGELSAAISTLTAVMPPSLVPTALKQIWREGAAPTSDKARKQLEGIGIHGSQTSLPEAVDRYAEYLSSPAAKGKTQEQALRDLGITSRGGPEAIIAAVKARDILRENLNEIKQASDPEAMRRAMKAATVESPHAQAQAALQAARNEAGEQTLSIEALRPFAEAHMEKNLGYQDEKHTSWMEKLESGVNYSLGFEAPRTRRQNEIIGEAIRRAVPRTVGMIPETAEWENFTRNTPGLANLYEQLSPEEKAAIFDQLKSLTVKPAQVPMARPAPPPARPAGAGASGAQSGTPVSANGLPAGADGRLISLNESQARLLRSIDAKLGMQPWYGNTAGPLPIDGGDVGPRRA